MCDELQHHTNNKWNMNTHNNMQLTKHDTNDDVDFDNCVVLPCVERARRAHSFTPGDDTAHLIGSSSESIHSHPRSYSWRIPFDSISPFFLHFSFLSFSVYFLHNELFLELDNPIVMASLRYSAAEESEGTLNLPLLHRL